MAPMSWVHFDRSSRIASDKYRIFFSSGPGRSQKFSQNQPLFIFLDRTMAIAEFQVGLWQSYRLYHPGRNYYKIIPRNNYFCIFFVIITKIIPPNDFLCNVAGSRKSLFARNQAREFHFVTVTVWQFARVSLPQTIIFVQSFFVIILAAMMEGHLK